MLHGQKTKGRYATRLNSGEREPLSSLLPSIGREILSSAQSPTQLETNFTQTEKTISRHMAKRDG
jgi:hypothetical protein